MSSNPKNKLDFSLLNVGYAQHNADWNFKDIRSPFARIHYVREGQASILLDKEQITLRPGYLYLTPAHVQHSYSCNGLFSLYYIHIYENPSIRSSIFDRYTFPKEIQADELIADLVRRLHVLNPSRALPMYDPRGYDHSAGLMKNIALQVASPFAREVENQAIIHILMSRFLAGATDGIPDVDKRLLRVIDYIDEHIHRAISIEQLAGHVFLSKDHLIRLFKKQMNTTPVKYINQKKIEKAQLMMLADDCSIQQLSFALGFEHITYFNRLFKKIAGETPTNYRRRLST
ncbi:helix-turn-helix domain-containing protein [Sphingobacterium thalpophilum]|uniref:helix-turn-helix domain-containing protein n=1 Tax=Sphingobacterium thalpophilum TaxID=259 RepID=UPI003C757D5B